jgi:hypothetical protein
MQFELKKVEVLRGLLTDPRERISSEARKDLEQMTGSSYASVRYVAAATLGTYDGTLAAFVDDVLVPELVERARDARIGRIAPDEVVADAGHLFRVSGSLKAWGILAAIAGTTSDENVKKEAERYALDGFL